ncbi:hypothetical protein SSS_10469 [Sarcoptes scabiei]|nr:hypothetical protein SSS_10469 [Sarcoptes scabiei]
MKFFLTLDALPISRNICSNLLNSTWYNGQIQSLILNQKRDVIYYTHSRGKFRSNRAVLKRFFRLNWGGWIRPRAGRHKHLWRKPSFLRWWGDQHVACTEEQNKVLDQMVSARYKKPNYFVDDIYEPYQKRNNLVYVPMGKERVSRSYIDVLLEK